MSENSKRENREIPATGFPADMSTGNGRRTSSDGTADTNAGEKSDESVVPAKSANNEAAEAFAESMEERDSTERNAAQTRLRPGHRAGIRATVPRAVRRA